MAKKILYVHGFGSSGASGTVMMLRQQLYEKGVSVVAPDLPVLPTEAIALLRNVVASEQPDLIIGTSMGGFYTELLKGTPRILVNPSFQMSRTLTFKGMGRYPFLNKREDGAKDFKVDRIMIDQFKTLEKESFKNITSEEKKMVWGLFGKDDKITAGFQSVFCKNYGKEHFVLFDGEHRLNDKILNHVVMPLIQELLDN
ncbi:MAG: hypothetical protein J6R79_06975 [Bacteroidaceae bacterium]|nr:hypothetical protein [Bacteroidaceae bacterium]